MQRNALLKTHALIGSTRHGLACRSALGGFACTAHSHADADAAPLATWARHPATSSSFSTTAAVATATPPPPFPVPVGPTILLMSGGVESAVLVHYYEHHAHADPVYPLFVDYAQAAADRERAAAREATAAAGGALLEVDARSVGEQLRALHAPARPHVPVPHRNLCLLSLAASFAPTVGATTVSLALCADDLAPPPGGGHSSNHPGGGGDKDGGGGPADAAVRRWPQPYSTASPAFLDAARAMLATLSPPLGLVTPLSQLSKAAIVSMGARLPALNLAGTWSCAKGGAAHCGQCVQCKARREAFRVAGVPEAERTYEKAASSS
jgi:7-cyano-7-deazaguanine synthase